MNRLRTLFLAALIAAVPMADVAAAAQSQGPTTGMRRDRETGARQEQAREESREGRRLSASDVARIVSRGRQGRMLGISERPTGGRSAIYIVRWEYPGGRVSDIMVDARTGSIMGER